MEENFHVQNPEKQKLNEEQDIHGNSKCLGSLPDVVIRHILSFLPTKDAVRTSVLSKRWEFLWTSIPTLDFHLILPAKRTDFMNFVERVLCLHDAEIKKFYLACEVSCDAPRVNSWISAAVRKNVRVLFLSLTKPEGIFSLPNCLFSPEKLEDLTLRIPYLVRLPHAICFSSLKILTMLSIKFEDECSTQKLFSGLPVLEKLRISFCSWGLIKVVSISAPRLHVLSICESETENSDYCQIMIFGNSLKEIFFGGQLSIDHCLFYCFKLEKADINLDSWGMRSKEIGYRVYKLLMALYNVKYLALSVDVVQVLSDAPELLPHVPVFDNLMELVFNKSEVDLSCVALQRILDRSPCLQTLTFAEGISFPSDLDNDDGILDPVPPCFKSHLKCIKVIDYTAHEDSLLAMKILLKKAVALDTMVISWCPEGDLVKQKLFEPLLELFPKGSNNCEIVFE